MRRRGVTAVLGATVAVFALVAAISCWAGDGGPSLNVVPTATPRSAAANQGPPFYTLADLGVKLAYARIDASGTGTLVVQAPDGTSFDVRGARGVFSGIAWSPDGSKIAASFGPSREEQDIYTVGADGQGLAQLTRDGHSRRPTWSPDGLTIAFSNGLSGNQGEGPVFTIAANGSQAAQLSRDPRDDNPAWAPDGSVIAASREAGSLVLISPETGADQKQVQLLRESSPSYSSLDWTPDSRALAAVALRGTALAIVVLEEDLTSQRQVGGAFLGSPVDPAATHPSWVPGIPKLIAASAVTGHLLLVDALALPTDMPSTAPYSPVQVLVPAPRGTRLAYPAVFAPRGPGGASDV